MGKIFCVEFQRYPLKFHTKYLAHTLKDAIFIQYNAPVFKEVAGTSLNSLRPSDPYMRQQRRPSLVQMMACRLVGGTKPLSESMQEYC